VEITRLVGSDQPLVNIDQRDPSLGRQRPAFVNLFHPPAGLF
jgi:hypothetical protein